MQAVAPAKLTLSLHVTGQRADGYHLLDALVVFTELGDEVYVTPSSTLSLAVSGEFSDGLSVDSDNLVYRAARALQARYDLSLGAQISLNKQLPVAAGLGGGSSDAATTLLLLNRLWGLHKPIDELCLLAETLGADVPACLYQRSLRMRGIGEEITLLDELPWSGWLVLANPNRALLTADVYRAYCSHRGEASKKVNALLRPWRNDLQLAACSLCPDIELLLQALGKQGGCEESHLCGSGATCYGWFPSQRHAEAAARRLQSENPGWWVRATALIGA